MLGLSGNALSVLPGNKAEPATKEIKKTHIQLGSVFAQANKFVKKIEAKEYNAAVYDMDTLLQQLFIGGLDDSTDYQGRQV